MKPAVVALITAILFIVSIGFTYWGTGLMKDREFAARLAAAPHKHDSSTTMQLTPQPKRDSSAHARPSSMTHADSARIDSAFCLAWKGGKDSTKTLIERLAAKAETSVKFDSTATVDVEYNPIDRMFTIGLQLAPIREIKTKITDSATVPIYEHDSFLTRTAIFTAGAGAAAILLSLTR